MISRNSELFPLSLSCEMIDFCITKACLFLFKTEDKILRESRLQAIGLSLRHLKET